MPPRRTTPIRGGDAFAGIESDPSPTRKNDAKRTIRSRFLNGTERRRSASVHSPAAIHLAAKEDHTDCLEALLEAGADLNQLEASSSTPLMYAAYYGGPAAARFLVEAGADLEARDVDGLTALALAQDQGNEKIEQLLLSAGAA